MRKFAIMLAVGAVAVIAVLGTSRAQMLFDPSVHKLVRLEPLVFGSEDNNFHMEPKEYRLRVGQGYRLKIRAETDFEYAFIAPTFFSNIFIRKIEVGEVEIKTRTLEEIEFEDEAEVELFFVAIRPGTYQFSARNMEERGMVGQFIVESDK